jgi:phosphoribosylaminoimidazolecarboxamide formyltransferase/IMP cyclohydrolase
MKYAQSNNVVLAYQGQVVAVASGQQSRVDCVKLACRKLGIWWGRHHPKVEWMKEKFRTDIGLKRNDKVNCAVRYVEGDFTEIEYQDWCQKFVTVPPALTELEKKIHLSHLTGVSMASDAFFPFRDNIDHASKVGVSYIIQPGGSVADQQVIEACNQYGMAMAFSGVRVFTH